MPVELDTPVSTRPAGGVELGMLNLLSGGARDLCLRQVLTLLNKAAGRERIRLRLFSLPKRLRRGEAPARADVLSYDFRALLRTRLDGLIVTGAEPRAERLQDEVFWPQFTDVVDWAQTNTQTTIWSCLAAHGAVLHLDGIERRRLARKCSGVFDVQRQGAHPLLAGFTRPVRVYHSRWNELAERDLSMGGYRILTRGTIGVDSFVKTRGSRFVFLQGHPEYDRDALGREYRRDVRRFLAGGTDTYPSQPVNYFSPATSQALLRFEDEARHHRHLDLMTQFPLPDESSDRIGGQTPFGEGLFRNWLRTLTTEAQEDAVA